MSMRLNNLVLAALIFTGSILPSFADSNRQVNGLGASKHFNRLDNMARQVKNTKLRRALMRELKILRNEVLLAEVQDINIEVQRNND